MSSIGADGHLCNLQAVSESLPLKRQIFSSFSQILRPDAILASNTSSISITKIAAAAVPEGVSPAGDRGKKAAGRVVGQYLIYYRVVATLILKFTGLHFFNPVPVMVRCHSAFHPLICIFMSIKYLRN